jgi:hypothetical protein
MTGVCGSYNLDGFAIAAHVKTMLELANDATRGAQGGYLGEGRARR